MKVDKWFWKKQQELDDDILVSDEWYQYYRKCTNNLKKILGILDGLHKFHIRALEKTMFWDEIIDIRSLADVKDPEEMKEWLVRCKTINNPPKKIQNGYLIKPQKKQVSSERRKELHRWKKRANAVNIDLLPSSRPFQGQRKEWEESIVKAEKKPKTKSRHNNSGEYKEECINKLEFIKKGSSLLVKDRIYQTVDWWIRGSNWREKELKDKIFHIEEIDHNTQRIWRTK